MLDLMADNDFKHGGALSVTVNSSPEPGELAVWDELVRTVPGSDVAQLSAWADVRRAAGFEPLYLFVRRGAELVGGAQVLQRRLPMVGMVGYVPYGPVVLPGVDGEPLSEVVAAALRRLAGRTTKILFVQPPLDGHEISRELVRLGFRPSHAGIAPAASLRLDLAQDEDELRARLPKSVQKWTRKWPARGVSVRRGTQGDVAVLARLHAASAQYQNFEPLPFGYLAAQYRRLAPDGHAQIFVGEVDGTPVVARLFTGCAGVITARLAGMERDSAAARLNVSTAVHWEAIRWAKANGYRWYDFGGIRDTAVSAMEHEGSDLSELTSSEAFKVSFGGMPFRYPTPVEIISSPVVRLGYDLAMRWPRGRRLVDRASHHMLRIGRGASSSSSTRSQ